MPIKIKERISGNLTIPKVAQLNREAASKVIIDYLQSKSEGRLRIKGLIKRIDIPFIRQQGAVTCFWACCLSVNRAVAQKFGQSLDIPTPTEAQVTRQALQQEFLTEAGTSLGDFGRFTEFVREQLGLELLNHVGKAENCVRKILADIQDGNVTLLNFPAEVTAHWNVVYGMEVADGVVKFFVMDPLTGSRVIPHTDFINRLVHITQGNQLIQAQAVTVVLPKKNRF